MIGSTQHTTRQIIPMALFLRRRARIAETTAERMLQQIPIHASTEKKHPPVDINEKSGTGIGWLLIAPGYYEKML